METFPKFIIEDDSLILAKVTFHKELVTDHTKVKGGGWFRYDSASNTFIFYGQSEDFGPAKFEDIKACVQAGKVEAGIILTRNISLKHNFAYDTQSEIIKMDVLAIDTDKE